MNTVGIVSEYNPFHNGHAYMIEELKRQGYDTVICAMSGNFVQRGEPAIMEKYARAEAAVRGGADLVLEIPTPWSMATAEIFARGGVEILQMAGCETLAFGAETPEIEKLLCLAKTLISEQYHQKVSELLQCGITFAQAREQAVESICGKDAQMLKKPNNNLAVEYIKAIISAGYGMKFQAVQRKETEHDGEPGETIAPASAIRKMLKDGSSVDRYIGKPTLDILSREKDMGKMPVDLAMAERAVISQLRKLTEQDLQRFDGGNEGLYHRVYQAIKNQSTLEDILDEAKTKRYTHARLRRMLMNAFLRVDEIPATIPYLKVLGASEQGIAFLHEKKKEKLPFLTKPADVERLGADAVRLMKLEASWTDQYVLFYPEIRAEKAGSEWRSTPAFIK